MIGTRLGPYEIIEELGKGGMATVYRAYHPGMERFVAVKIIHKALAQDEQGMERFRQEARLIARLEHPHLLPVYDYAPSFYSLLHICCLLMYWQLICPPNN